MIEIIPAWEYMNGIGRATGDARPTYSQITEVAKVKVGRKFQYVVPYGIDWECDGGHSVEVLTQEEFDKRFSIKEKK